MLTGISESLNAIEAEIHALSEKLYPNEGHFRNRTNPPQNVNSPEKRRANKCAKASRARNRKRVNK